MRTKKWFYQWCTFFAFPWILFKKGEHTTTTTHPHGIGWRVLIHSFFPSRVLCVPTRRGEPRFELFLLSHFSWGRARSHQEGSFLHNSREKAEKKKLNSEQGEAILRGRKGCRVGSPNEVFFLRHLLEFLGWLGGMDGYDEGSSSQEARRRYLFYFVRFLSAMVEWRPTKKRNKFCASQRGEEGYDMFALGVDLGVTLQLLVTSNNFKMLTMPQSVHWTFHLYSFLSLSRSKSRQNVERTSGSTTWHSNRDVCFGICLKLCNDTTAAMTIES